MRNLIRETKPAGPPSEQAILVDQAAGLEEVEEATTCLKTADQLNPTPEQDTNDRLIESMFCDDVDIFGDHTGNNPTVDSSQRYFINRLYQPMNSSSGEGLEPEALADDEYLFYQELRFFESTVQELTGGCGSDRVSFSKILEEDEDDVSRLCDEIERQVDGDLHLTTIIDSFNHHSFHAQSTAPTTCTPPLIESSRDPMMTEACHPEKPDSSTRTESHFVADSSLHQHEHHQLMTPTEQHQFMCNNDNNNGIAVEEHSMSHIQESNFASMGTEVEDHHLRHQQEYEPSQHLQHFHHNHLIEDQQHQPICHSINLDDSSSLQQQVSSSFASSHNNSSDNSFSNTSDSNFDDTNQLQNNQTSHIKQQVVSTAPTSKSFEPDSNEDSKMFMGEREPPPNKRLRCTSIQQQHSPSTTKVTSSNNYGHSIEADFSPLDSSSFRLDEEDHENITSEEDEGNSAKQPPHMVKYRRRTANARERIRMREINQAFEKLKKVVPVELIHTVSAGDESDTSIRRSKNASSDQKSVDPQALKLTKITTLRLAVSYISKLSELLQQQEGGNSPIVISSTGDHQVSASGKSASASSRKSGANKRSRKGVGSRSTGRATKSSHDKTRRRPKLNSNQESTLESNQAPVNAPTSITQSTLQHTRVPEPQNFIIATTNGSAMQPVATTNGLQLKQQPTTLQMMQAYSGAQPLTISHQTASQANIQNRTFVTPVAVAILGIQTTGNQRSATTPNEPQALQLVGLQTGHQLHHQRAHHPPTYYTQQAHQAPQASVDPQQQQYNLISSQQPQPQQLTFTLNSDMNGLSVLRLASTKGSQLHCQPIVQQQQNQQPVVGNYANYATYQPVRISQPAAAGTQALMSSRCEPQTGNDINMDCSLMAGAGSERLIRNNETLGGKMIISEEQQIETNQSVAVSNRNTGKISGRLQFESQHQNNNANLIQAYEVKPDQSGSANGGTMLAIAAPSGEQVIQQQQQQITGGLDWLCRPQPSHIIYLSPSSLSRTGKQAHFQQLQVSQQVSAPPKKQPPNQSAPRAIVGDEEDRSGASAAAELQFATSQFSSQPATSKLPASQEANIRQLVASLTTSIHPRTSGQAGNHSQLQGEERTGEQRQQLKRTYRFHNYDGAMITNHLYGSSHHNQTHENQAAKQQKVQPAMEQQQMAPALRGAQRSRLNSLSSTCSATSSSSSSSLMFSGVSSSPPEVTAIKSPGEGSTATATVSS